MIPSSYQQAVYDEIEEGTGNIVINAVAGSGKTTTIVHALKKISIRKRILFCAFNNSIVTELKNRCPSHVRVTTLHSLGWYAMNRYYGRETIELDPNKAYKTAEKLYKSSVPPIQRNYYFLTLSKLVDLYRVNLARGRNQLLEIAIKHDIDFTDEMIDQALVLHATMAKNTKVFDFTDMIYVPAILDDIRMDKYDYIFIDECQDLNTAQQTLVMRCRAKECRVISVGDKQQAIYGFAGADHESFEKLANMEDTKVLPLSICYRCAKTIVEKAQEIVPHIEFHPSAPEGECRAGSTLEIRNGDWVLCRNVKPLIVLCVDLISKGKRAHVKGAEIGRAIITMLRKTEKTSYKSALLTLLTGLKKLEKDLLKQGVFEPLKHPRYVNMKERISVIAFLGRGCISTKQIISQLERIFKEEQGGISLSTIHKSKGLENDRVFIICPELLPSKYATQPWQLEQERNLTYVAYTRAKKQLIIVNDFTQSVSDFRSVDLTSIEQQSHAIQYK